MEGRGREFGHSCIPNEPSAAPTLSFDYAFISDGDVVLTQEEFEAAGEDGIKFIVVRESKSKAIFGRVVPTKGIDEKGFSDDSLADDIKWLGYAKLTLKSDNETAIVKLLREALKEMRIHGVPQSRSTRQSTTHRPIGLQKLE